MLYDHSGACTGKAMRIRNSWITNMAVVQLLSIILTLCVMENMAQHSFLPTTRDEGNKLPHAVNNNIQSPGDFFVSYPFHEVYSMTGKDGEIQRIHYATDDKGMRANFYSNDVNSPVNFVPTGPQSSFVMPLEGRVNKPINDPANNPGSFPYVFPLNYDINFPFNKNIESKKLDGISSLSYPTGLHENLRVFKNDILKNKEHVQTQALLPNSRDIPSVKVNSYDIYPSIDKKQAIIPSVKEQNYQLLNRVPTEQNNDNNIILLSNTGVLQENAITDLYRIPNQQQRSSQKYNEEKLFQNSNAKPKINSADTSKLTESVGIKPADISYLGLTPSYGNDIPKKSNTVSRKSEPIKEEKYTTPSPITKPSILQNTRENKYSSRLDNEEIPEVSKFPNSLSIADLKNRYLESLNSPSVSTVFDISNDKGRFYHYVLNMVQPVSSVTRNTNKYFTTGNALLKLLDEAKIPYAPEDIAFTQASKPKNTEDNLTYDPKAKGSAQISTSKSAVGKKKQTSIETTTIPNSTPRNEFHKDDSRISKNVSEEAIKEAENWTTKTTDDSQIFPNALLNKIFATESTTETSISTVTEPFITKPSPLTSTDETSTQNIDTTSMFIQEENEAKSYDTVDSSVGSLIVNTTNVESESLFITIKEGPLNMLMIPVNWLFSSTSNKNDTDDKSEVSFTNINKTIENETTTLDFLDSTTSPPHAALNENEYSDTTYSSEQSNDSTTLGVPSTALFPISTTPIIAMINKELDTTTTAFSTESTLTNYASTPSFMQTKTSVTLDDNPTTSFAVEMNKSEEETNILTIPEKNQSNNQSYDSKLDANPTTISAAEMTEPEEERNILTIPEEYQANNQSYDSTLNNNPTTTSTAEITESKEKMNISPEKNETNNQSNDSTRRTSISNANLELAPESKKSIVEGMNATNAMIVLQVSDMKEFMSHINDLPLNLVSMIGNLGKSNKSQEKIIHKIAHKSMPEKLLNKDKNKTEVIDAKAKSSKLSKTSVTKQSPKRRKSSSKSKNDSKKQEDSQMQYSLIHPLLLENEGKSLFSLPHDDKQSIIELSDIFATDKPVDTLNPLLENTFYDTKESTFKQHQNFYNQHQSNTFRNGYSDITKEENKPGAKVTTFDINAKNSKASDEFGLVNDMINHYPSQNSQHVVDSNNGESTLQFFNQVPLPFYSISNTEPEVVQLVEKIDFKQNNLNENKTHFFNTLDRNVYSHKLRANDSNSLAEFVPNIEIFEYIPFDPVKTNLQSNLETRNSRNVESENPLIFLDEYANDPIDSIRSTVQSNLEIRDSSNRQSETPVIFLEEYANGQTDSVQRNAQSNLERRNLRNVQSERSLIFLDEYADTPIDSIRSNLQSNLEISDTRNRQSENPVIFLEEYANGQTESVRRNAQSNLETRNLRSVQSENPLIFLDGYADTPIDSVRSTLQSNSEISDTRNRQSENPVIFLEEYAHGQTDSVRINAQRNIETRNLRSVQSENPLIFLDGYADTPIDSKRNNVPSNLEIKESTGVQLRYPVIYLDESANGLTDFVRSNAQSNLEIADSRNLQSENPVVFFEDNSNAPLNRQQNIANILTAEITDSENQFSNEEPNILIVDDPSFGARLRENPEPENAQPFASNLNVYRSNAPESNSVLSRAPWLK